LELIPKELQKRGVLETLAQAAAEGLRTAGLLDKGKDLKGKEALETGQAVLLGHAEINYLVKRCAELTRNYTDEKALKTAIAMFLKEEKKNIEALVHGSGLESALFGRMVTSDLLASRDASV
jgi:CRISPR system Cascade subunit CasC